MQIRHLYNTYFFVVLIYCSRHLMLLHVRFDVHRLADNTEMKLIYASIIAKFSQHLVIWQPF